MHWQLDSARASNLDGAMECVESRSNLERCKTVVKSAMPPATQLGISILCGENDLHTEMDCRHRKPSLSRKHGLILSILLLMGLPTDLLAQAPWLPSANQARSAQPGPEFGGASGQYRPCTPADYGDPAADCIPSTGQQPGSSSYNEFSEFSSYPSVPSGPRLPSSDLSPDRAGAIRDNSSPNQPVYTPKEPPTEFQRYVAGSVGLMLPIFGATLFEHVPATFAPLDRAPVSVDYAIGPGDELQIAVWGQLNFSRRLTVARTGQVILPDAGPISVEGLNYSQAASVIKSQLSHFYRSFDVSVTLSRLHSIQIFVVGEAQRPGSYTVSSFSTLVNAIFASGGPSSRGSMRNIQLKRGDQTVKHFDLYQLLVYGDKSQDAQLIPGDVIFIGPAGPRVAISGSVGHPAIYEIEPGTTLAAALQLADGLSPLALMKQAMVERVAEGSSLQVLHVSMNPEGLRTELRNGDIVRLLPVVRRFQNAVTLRGNVAAPGRFPWQKGMRLNDLIPNKESLLTRDYWKAHNALGSAEEPIDEDDPETLDQTSQANANGGTLSGQTTAPGNLRKSNLQMGFQEQKRNTQADASLGAAMSPDNVAPFRTFTPRYTVQPAVPEINWEYAVIERTDQATLATRTIAFNLGKLVLSYDETQNVELLPGDVVTIFSKADFAVPRSQQRTQLRIEGEVAMAGAYTALPGETLRQVLTRAGGLTPNAYIYGAQLTRESTRREQQKRYDDFLNQLEREIGEAASNLSSRVTSPQEAATAQTSLASQRDMIERLRKVAMNGRIVLNVSPEDRGIGAFPDLPVENGDRLYVPSRPSTVNVIGTVYEQASFLYEEDYRAGDYLKKAGGPSRAADRSHMLVVRADGSVVSRRIGSTMFAKSFDGLPMFPGDTLVVPTYINRTTFVRSLIDWSQILSNFGLGAAAINVLH
ncbi:MAG: Capsular polysaccharide export system protein KpsC [Bryobacterales bacterium]|nr:Capsular polysaccharide export system protein KpsC [Bryobacterales bacterium]